MKKPLPTSVEQTEKTKTLSPKVFAFLVSGKDYRIESRLVVSLVAEPVEAESLLIVDVESDVAVDIVDVLSTTVADDSVVSVLVLEQAVVSVINDSIRNANLAMFVLEF